MKSEGFENFSEFWPFYVMQHQDATNRRLHFLGTNLALIWMAMSLFTHQYKFILFTPVFGYFFAWLGHVLVERNRPATWQYPWWSLRADFRMLMLMWSGKMDPEVMRWKARARQ